MKDYRVMSPCERVSYYRDQIRRLTPPASSRERLLLVTLQRLVAENAAECPDGAPPGKPKSGA